MRIVCPNCAAAYEVPGEMLAARPEVRCARCGTDWHPEPLAASLPPQPVTPPPPSTAVPAAPAIDIASRAGAALERPAVAPTSPTPPAPSVPPPISDLHDEPAPLPMPSRRGASAVRLAWAGTVMALVVLGWAAYTWRTPIMQAWPPSERIYAALGLA